VGQQQLLIIVLGTIVVALAVAVGISLVNGQASASNRDEVANDLMRFASTAQAYYRKPKVVGGGGGSFGGLEMKKITSKPVNVNGSYALDPDPVSGTPLFVTLTGTGTEIGNDGTTHVKLVMYVYRDSTRVDEALTN
jgi:hypothetical protein